MRLSVAEQYVAAFGNIAKEGNTVLLPSHAADPASMVAQALAVMNTTGNKGGGTALPAAITGSGEPVDTPATPPGWIKEDAEVEGTRSS